MTTVLHTRWRVMARSGRMLRFGLVLALALLTQASAIAQPESLSVDVAIPERGYVGDSVPLIVTVQGSREAQQPAWPQIDGAEIGFLRSEDRSSSFTMSINGQTTTRRTITMVMVYEVRFDRTGVFEIPAIDVVVGAGPSARRLTSQPARIRIEEPTEDPEFGLEFMIESTRVFVGQPVLATLTWIVGKPVRNVRVSLPFDPSIARLVPGPSSTPTRSSTTGSRGAVRSDPRQFETTLNGQPVTARIDERVVGGTRRQALTVDVVFIPQRSGRLSVGPARVDYDAVIGQRPRRFTDAPWDDLSILERQASIASPVDITVLPLPADSRPANFSGLVGRYEIASSSRPVSASVGEPIELTVTVKGPHPISLVPALDLASQMTRSEPLLRIPADPILPNLDGGVARFDVRVRARSDQVREIPPIGLTYFDPVDEAYRTAWSNPIPISIHGSASIGLPDDDDGDSGPTGTTEAEIVRRELPGGMADIHRSGLDGRPILLDRRISGLSLSWLGAAAVAPAFMYAAGFVGIGLARWWRSDANALRLRRARRRALTSVQAIVGGDVGVADAGSVLTTLIGDCAGTEGQAITAREAMDALPTSLPVQLRARVTALIDSTEWEFAPDAAEGRDRITKVELRSLIDRIVRCWKQASLATSVSPKQGAA